jgi:flagellar hook-basal body complex protein FliE
MSSRRCFILSLAVIASLAGSACGDPPDKEMSQAQTAIDAARGSGAERYARDEFTAAQEALKKAKEAVADRDYRQALNNALDARERAQNASKEAAERKATTRGAAEFALKDATSALRDANEKLKTAEANRAANRAIVTARHTITDADTAVQKARAAFSDGDFTTATDIAHAATARLRGAAGDLDAVTAVVTRRRH